MKVLFTTLLAATVLFSQERISITGRVVSAEDNVPIVGASVLIVNTTMGTSTDGEGSFSFRNIPKSRNRLQVSAVGYKSTTIDLSETAAGKIIVRLVPSLIQTQAVVVTANKRSQSLEEIPVSVSIITAKMFEQKNIVALDDALRYVPGVNFQQSQVNIRASSGYSRGAGSRVTLLVDGMPLLTGDTGEITFESIPVFQIDRVEVVKGAGSTLYGSGALGGVINVLTKEAEKNSTLFWKMYSGIYSNPEYSQWKWTDKARLTNGQMVGFSSTFGNLGATFSAARNSDDGYRESDWLRKYNAYVKLDYNLSPYQSLAVSSNFYQQYRADFLWWKDLQNALRPADMQRNVTVTSLRFNNSVYYKHFVNEEFYFEVKAIHFRGNWHSDSVSIRQDGSISDAAITDIQGNLTLDKNNVLTFGIDGNYNRVRSDIFGSHEGRGGALYVQDEYVFSEEFSATIGIRHDIQQVFGTFIEQQTNPKIGLRYQAAEGHTIRFSAGRGFRTPSIGELYTSTANTGGAVIVVPNVNLQPERSWTFEISTTQALTEHLQLDAAVFRNDFYDFIEPNVFFDQSDNAGKINFKNTTQARIQGFETSMLSTFFDHSAVIDFHYNYNWAVDRNTGSFLRFRPRHIAGAHFSYSYNVVTVGADYRYVSKIEQIDEQLVELAPINNGKIRVSVSVLDVYLVANLYDIGLPCRVTLNINNALGYNYNELIGNVSPPRNFVLSLDGIIQ